MLQFFMALLVMFSNIYEASALGHDDSSRSNPAHFFLNAVRMRSDTTISWGYEFRDLSVDVFERYRRIALMNDDEDLVEPTRYFVRALHDWSNHVAGEIQTRRSVRRQYHLDFSSYILGLITKSVPFQSPTVAKKFAEQFRRELISSREELVKELSRALAVPGAESTRRFFAAALSSVYAKVTPAERVEMTIDLNIKISSELGRGSDGCYVDL